MDFEDFYDESPFLGFLKPRLEEWRDGHVRVRLPIQPVFLNRSGVVHGGIYATILDHGCGMAGLYCPVPGHRRYGLTLSLTTSFVGQSKGGDLIVTGTRTGGGRRVFFSEAEVKSEDGATLATGNGVFRYRTGSEVPEGVPARDLS